MLTRAGRQPGARVFALLAGYLVVWSVAIIVQRLTEQPAIVQPVNAIEDVAAFLLPVGTLHIALALAVEGRRSVLQQSVLDSMYVVSGVMAAGAVLFPDQQFAVLPPHFELPEIPGDVFGWAWIIVRVLVFAAALYWIIPALSFAGADQARRAQLIAALATVAVGALGGVLRFLPGPADSDPWFGGRCVELLLALGKRYERRGDRPAAAASFRQARNVAGDELPPADEALARLGASA